MGRYEDLGIGRVINAAATLTRLGGSRMPAPVIAAMTEGAEAFVDLDLLQRRVGERIAELTNNEAAYISCGAAAGLTIATAACMVGTHAAGIAALPRTGGARREVIIHRSHRNGYDHAVRQTGARLVEIGMAHMTHPWELEAAIGPRTACLVYFAGSHYSLGSLPLPEVINIAHAHGVPVLVDAAAQIPPVANLWYYTRELGADVAIFSGGKGLRGPQSSGLVVGRSEIIDACRANGNPNSSIGRPMKVGKEELLGILAAVEWTLAQDEPALLASYEQIVSGWIEGLSEIPGVCVERGYPSEAGQPHSRAIIRLDASCAWRRDDLVRALAQGQPPIAVGVIGADAIALNPQTLEPGEDAVVLDSVRRLLAPLPR